MIHESGPTKIPKKPKIGWLSQPGTHKVQVGNGPYQLFTLIDRNINENIPHDQFQESSGYILINGWR